MARRKLFRQLREHHERMVHVEFEKREEIFYGCDDDDDLRAVLVAARIRHRDAFAITAWERRKVSAYWGICRYRRFHGTTPFDTLFKTDPARADA